MRCVVSLLPCVIAICLFSSSPARADSGLYLSSELGANFAPSVDTTGSSNDRASMCDEFINPRFATVTENPRYENYNCTGPNRGATGDWKNKFDSAEGILAGAAMGYRLSEKYPDSLLGRFRLELEYFYRSSEYDETSDVPGAAGESGDKLVQEIRTATDCGSLAAPAPARRGRGAPARRLGRGVLRTRTVSPSRRTTGRSLRCPRAPA